jgi:hypothetical protein
MDGMMRWPGKWLSGLEGLRQLPCANVFGMLYIHPGNGFWTDVTGRPANGTRFLRPADASPGMVIVICQSPLEFV